MYHYKEGWFYITDRATGKLLHREDIVQRYGRAIVDYLPESMGTKDSHGEWELDCAYEDIEVALGFGDRIEEEDYLDFQIYKQVMEHILQEAKLYPRCHVRMNFVLSKQRSSLDLALAAQALGCL